MLKMGVIVARFQVPYLHIGHKHLIDEVMVKSDIVVILLGTSPVPNAKNPLSFEQREAAIRQFYPDVTEVIIQEIKDNPSNEEWSKSLDAQLEDIKEYDITLYGSRDSFHKVYSGIHKYKYVDQIDSPSGTDIRRQIIPLDTPEFRAGVIYAYQQMENLKN